MSLLRSRPRSIARLLLAWFAVALAVASAAPLVHAAQGLERLCTASGEVRWVASAGADAAAPAGEAAGHGLECALCLPPLATPPPPPAGALAAPPPALHAAVAPRPRHAPPLSRAPFPPRAPPAAARV